MRVLGIDLGTTNSAIALVNEHGQPEVLANREGEYTTPSVVFFDGEEPIVGRVAKRSAALSPENVVQFVKREMGNQHWTFSTEGGAEFTPEMISSLILRRLKEDAEMIRGEAFTHAVISVPAYFMEAERLATQSAAELAGLSVPPGFIINEPTAAALSYGLGSVAGLEHVVVYDLGGGTFDVTVLRVAPGELTVLGTGGDRKLGGVDWDNELMTWLDEQFIAGGGSSLLDDPRTEQDLRDKSETAKHTLSQMRQTKVVLSAGNAHQTIVVTREQLEELTTSLLERTQVLLEEVVEDSGLRWNEMSKVLLVGGSTKMPAVAGLIQRVTGLAPSREVHPDEAVALGAAVQGALRAKDLKPERASAGSYSEPAETGLVEVNITDVTAHSLGIVLVDNAATQGLFNKVVIERGSRLPARSSITFYTIADNQTYWKAQITQGEERDLRFVVVVGEGEIGFDSPKPVRYPLDLRLEYDTDGLIHAYVFDGVSKAPFGELHIQRQNRTTDELAAMKEQVSGLSLG